MPMVVCLRMLQSLHWDREIRSLEPSRRSNWEATLESRAVARAVDPVIFLAVLVLVVGARDGFD